MSDEYLLECLKADPNDIAPLKAIFDKYHKLLVHHCAGIVDSREEAQDIVQEVFIAFFIEKKRYEEINGRLFSYLMSVCDNASYQFLRKNNRLRLKKEEYAQVSNEQGTDNSALDKIILKEDDDTRMLLVNAFEKKMPAVRKNLFEIRYLQSLSYQRLAQQTGLSINSIKTHLRFAFSDLKRLRREMDPDKIIFKR